MLNLLTSHKTVRKYADKKISEQTLNRLLTASCRASNNGNMQTYSIVISIDEEVKKQLAPAHFNQPMITEAAAVLTFCVDFNRFSKWCKMRNANPGYANFLSYSSGSIDAMLAAQNFCIAAESEGFGICYLGTTLYNPMSIVETLKLPKLVFPVSTVTIGYPAEVPAKQEDRLPLTGIAHHEVYHDYSEEKINEVYANKEALESNKEFVKINNKETLPQVFTDIRYTQKDNEAMSKTLLDALKKQGFMD